MVQWVGQKGSKATGRVFEPWYRLCFYILYPQWLGQKDSGATGCGFEPRYRLSTILYRKLNKNLPVPERIYRLDVAVSNCSISYVSKIFTKKYTEAQFFQTSKSTPL